MKESGRDGPGAANLRNVDDATVSGFGQEWSTFDQSQLSDDEARELFERYFSLVDLDSLPEDAVVADVGCGSGRWAQFVAPRVGRLWLVDPSAEALAVATRNLQRFANCEAVCADADRLPIDDDSCDLIYSLGVLHHVPDTAGALRALVPKLKPGAPLLVYLYYRFDQRPMWFRALWAMSDRVRKLISRLPFAVRRRVTDVIALCVYWPAARLSRWFERRGRDVDSMPLSYYRHLTVYTMRTDALDRFGTRLEQRFTRPEIEQMMLSAGLVDIDFRADAPYWCAVGYRGQ